MSFGLFLTDIFILRVFSSVGAEFRMQEQDGLSAFRKSILS